MNSLVSLSAALATVLHPAATAPVQFGEPPVEDTAWTNPSILGTMLRPRTRVFAAETFYYGEFKGRKLELNEFMFGLSATADVSLWTSRQNVLLKGRSGGRYRNDSQQYGIKWLLKAASPTHKTGVALDFESVRPESATATSGGAEITYPKVKVDAISLTGSNANGLMGQLLYANVDANDSTRGQVLAFAVGRDYQRGRLRYQLQAQAVGQHITNSIDDVNFEIKPIFTTAASYRLTGGLRLESDLTLMPSGTPLWGGRLTPLTSFQIYRPSGVAADLRREAFGYASLRLMYHKAL